MSRFPIVALLGLMACDNDKLDDGGEAETIERVKVVVKTDLDSLNAASTALCAAAPAPDADGWNATDDAAAVTTMQGHWRTARVSYERIEGAIAVLFPDLDISSDERYDGFISVEADDNLFDGEGVTGVHAIERILWSDVQPQSVIDFESALPNYSPAAFPATMAEATDFRDGLCARLVADTQAMTDQFEPLALDPAAAYGGVVGSMAEQAEKTSLASGGEEESRYAQHTLADMRANLAGGRSIYAAFSPWIVTTDEGAAEDAEVLAGFDRIEAGYDTISGDAIPAVPETWNPDAPTEADLATPYGQLFTLVHTEADPDTEGTLVHAMVHAAAAVEITVAP